MRDESIALGGKAVATAGAAVIAAGLTWWAIAAAIVGAVASLHFEPEHVPAKLSRLIFGIFAIGFAAALVAAAAPAFPGFAWTGRIPVEVRAGLLGLSVRFLFEWGKRLAGTGKKVEG